MSHVNGDDIDEIFRRASERYPLRTDPADWDKLASDLERDPSLILPAVNADEGGRRKKRFFWLFLLLPLGGLGYYAVKVTTRGPVRQPAIVQSLTTTPAATPAQAPVPSTAINQNRDKIPSGGTTTSSGGETAKSNRPDHAGANADADAATTHFGQRPSTSFGSAKFSTPETAGQTVNQTGGQTAGQIARQTAGQTRRQTAGQTARQTTNPDALSDRNASGSPEEPRSYQPFGLKTAPTTGGIDLRVKVQSGHTAASTPAPIRLSKPARQASFYVGLLAAPDLSTVKFQSVKQVGTSFGLLLGYNINRKWAIESGLYLDRKKYYTDGEYFNTKKIYIPSGVNISNVNGTCNMWEIPLSIRYNFGEGEKMKWFATAGFSTYLMTKEHYTYMLHNATGQSYPYSKPYNTHSNYLFSVFDLSIGYEQKIGKIGNLRLEPYLRVPLSGIGTGSLPIMSAGLNIGITRRIW